jgi:hypothetical protein
MYSSTLKLLFFYIRIPVKIEVLDHDDSQLKFEQQTYTETLIESTELYENFMQIRAHDNDCTNDGYACSYKLLTKNLAEISEPDFAFKIDQATGTLSSTRELKSSEVFEFTLRAFDCISHDSFVDASILINVIEKCTEEWQNYSTELISGSQDISIFETLNLKKCDTRYETAYSKPETQCKIESVSARVTLNLDQSLKDLCKTSTKCGKKI